MKTSTLLFLLLCLLHSSFLLGQDRIYWTDKSKGIVSANKDGTELKTILESRIHSPTDVEINPENNKIYWVDTGKGHLIRANYDGSDFEVINNQMGASTYNIQLDLENQKIYWADFDVFKLYQSNIDGSNVEVFWEEIPFEHPAYFIDFHIDSKHEIVYWCNFIENKVQKSEFQSNEVVDVASLENSSGFHFHSLCVDVENEKLYWVQTVSNSNQAYIKWANLDGNNEEILKTAYNVLPEISLNLSNNKLYFTRGNWLYQSNLDGTNEQLLYNQLNSVRDFEVHPNEDMIIFLASVIGKLGRLTFSEDLPVDEEFFYQNTEDIINPHAIAIDRTNQQIYWSDYGLRTIKRCNFDGTSIETVYYLSGALFSSIALDIPNRKLYWSNKHTNNGTIGRVNLDGSNLSILRRYLWNPDGLIVDLEEGYMYYSVQGNTRIIKASIDGFETSELINVGTLTDHIAIDRLNQKIYWIEHFGDVFRANLDGTNEELLYQSGGYTGSGGLGVDVANNHVYFLRESSLFRMDTDGSNLISVTDEFTSPSRLDGHLAWQETGVHELGEFTSTLPLTWLSLTGQAIENFIHLNWTVAQINDSQRFEIQRKSPKDSDFQTIDAVLTDATNSDYLYLDKDITTEGLYYYRIVEIGVDGKQNISNTIAVWHVKKVNKIQVYPNPTTHQVTIDLPFLIEDKPALVRIFNNRGRQLKTFQFRENIFQIELSDLPTGIYWISVDRDGESFYEKLMKE